eukprot:jgi/Ulvmu1/2949/UM149_0032.1
MRYDERNVVRPEQKDATVDPVMYDDVKTDIDGFPFAQVPRLVDGDINIAQSNAILRHIARKYDMYGSTEADHCRVDEILDGVAALRGKYMDLVYGMALEDAAKAEHWDSHGNPDTMSKRNGGAHWGFLAALLKASGTGFVTGSAMTVADCALFDLADNYMRTFADNMRAQHPAIVEHYEMVKTQKGVKAHLESGKLHEYYNNNRLG